MNRPIELTKPIESYFGKLTVIESCESTQTLVRHLSEITDSNGTKWIAPHGTGIQTLIQTKGYGRQGKSWTGLPGNLFMSLLLKDSYLFGSNSIARTWAPLVIGYTLVQILNSEFPNLNANIKWPNDLRIHEKKFAGILVDSFTTHNELNYIVGIGINISSHPTVSDQLTTSIFNEISPNLMNETANTDLGQKIFSRLCGLQITENEATLKKSILGKLEKTYSKQGFEKCAVIDLGDFGEIKVRSANGDILTFTSPT